ncbi:hypothetical protein GCM10027612_12040 [Microbispora bryophytorum subsp. camponoti]
MRSTLQDAGRDSGRPESARPLAGASPPLHTPVTGTGVPDVARHTMTGTPSIDTARPTQHDRHTTGPMPGGLHSTPGTA